MFSKFCCFFLIILISLINGYLFDQKYVKVKSFSRLIDCLIGKQLNNIKDYYQSTTSTPFYIVSSQKPIQKLQYI